MLRKTLGAQYDQTIMPRKALVAQYDQTTLEPGLKALVDDLMKMPESLNNIEILSAAFQGKYSGMRSKEALPATALLVDLVNAAKTEPTYSSMLKAARTDPDQYEHDRGARRFPDISKFTGRMFKAVAKSPPSPEETKGPQIWFATV